MSKVSFNPDFFEPPATNDEIYNDTNATSSKIDRSEYLINLAENYPDIEYIMEINNIPTFPRGDIQAIKAKAKQGKTHAILCIIIALLKGCFLSIRSRLEKPKICYFATEEHKRGVAKLAKKVHRICKWSTTKSANRFLVYSIRSMSAEQRAEFVEQEITQERPDVVFIDGIRDLLNDFNNIKETSDTIRLLMRLSSDLECSIVCVLHTNKSKFDSNMRGHLGTELENKSSDVLEVEKVKDSFIVTQTECRNISTGRWGFSLDLDGLPEKIEQELLKTNVELNVDKIKYVFKKILSDGNSLSNAELKREYMKKAELKDSTADKHIRKMIDANFLIKNNGKYKLA